MSIETTLTTVEDFLKKIEAVITTRVRAIEVDVLADIAAIRAKGNTTSTPLSKLEDFFKKAEAVVVEEATKIETAVETIASHL